MIPVFDIKRQNKKIKKEIQSVVSKVIEDGSYILGENVDRFEKEFAKFIGVKYAVGCASGTEAITLSLLSLGIQEGDEVIMPANSYPSVFGVALSGAKPKLADIDRNTFNIDPVLVEKAINKKTKAILAVHLYGRPSELDKLIQISEEYNISLIEDCAQSCGAEIKFQNPNSKSQLNSPPKADQSRADKFQIPKKAWMKTGSVGKMGCFSFYPTKNLGAFGDGGMVVTNDEKLYRSLLLYRMYGEEKRYKSVLIGRNSRLDEIQAAVLRVKLKYVKDWNEKRRKLAEYYKKCFLSQKLDENISIPNFDNETDLKSVYHLYVIRCKKRDRLKEYLLSKGIQTGIHYPAPIHFQPSFKYLDFKKGDFPNSEKASQEVLSLPMFPELELDEIEKVVMVIREFYKTNL